MHIAPQTIMDICLCFGGQTRYGASFSSSLLQQYTLESLPMTTKHSSEKQNFFHASNVQFLWDLAHLTQRCLFFALTTIDFLINFLKYFNFLSCLYNVALPNLFGFSTKKVLNMWVVDAPIFVFIILFSQLALRVVNFEVHPLCH